MPLPAFKGQIRAAFLSMPVGLALLVGGCAAVALGERALGVVLITLAVVSPVVGGIVLVRVNNQVQAALSAERERQLAVVDEILAAGLNGSDGPDLPERTDD